MTEPAGKNDPSLITFRFIQGKKILIVDPSIAIRSTSINLFKDLGARHADIMQSPDFNTAEALIHKFKPQILVCDYSIDGISGLKLIQLRNKLLAGEKDLFSIIVTANPRESSIVEAAEEEIDCYLLKPFSLASFKSYIIRMIAAKVAATPAKNLIHQGRAFRSSNDFIRAEKAFREALQLDPKSCLAYFYLGEIYREKKEYNLAQKYFQDALKINPIHFRSLNGLFDLSLTEGKDKEAYQAAKTILEHFPVSAERLSQILRLAIHQHQFEEMDILYHYYLDTEFRDQNLIKTMIAALIVSGKHFLERKNSQHAIDLFRKAMISSGRSIESLRVIIESLLQNQCTIEAAEFLKELPQDQRGDPEFFSLDYMILDKTGTPAQIYEQGQKLLREGIHHSQIYEILIRRSKELGKVEMAMELAHKAYHRWPEREECFSKIIQAT